MPDLPQIDGLVKHFDAAKLDLPDGAPVNSLPAIPFTGVSADEQRAVDEHMRAKYGFAVPDLFA
jgi:hypothetical protein